MVHLQVENAPNSPEWDLVQRALRKDARAVREIIQTHNRRLYRTARSIVRDDGEAEDVLQEAYLRAFSALDRFRGESTLATWLTRIVLNEALQRLRRRTDAPLPDGNLPELREAQVIPFPSSGGQPSDPERTMAQRELCHLLEKAIDALPDDFRMVLVARAIEDMSVDETAELLGLRPETVKTRLHRARRLLKDMLADHLGAMLSDVFPFDGARCERITDAVMARLELSS